MAFLCPLKYKDAAKKCFKCIGDGRNCITGYRFFLAYCKKQEKQQENIKCQTTDKT